MVGKQIKRLSGLTVLMILICWVITTLGQPDAETAVSLSLGRVMADQPAEQVITFTNPTGKELVVENVQLTPPLVVGKITPVIEPGGQGQFTLALGNKRVSGGFEGGIQINFENNVIEPLVYIVEGFVIPPIEFKPRSAFSVATHRGEDKHSSIEIINHRPQPLNIIRAESQSDRFSVNLETLDPGQKYRLTLLLLGNASTGKRTDQIRLVTDSAYGDEITIQANTLIRERVYTFPESIDMGSFPISMIKDQSAAEKMAQTLMIYRLGTDDFEVTASTNLDSIQLHTERGPSGDRYEITVTLLPDKIRSSELTGTIYLETNDLEFRELAVPVTGYILKK